MSVEAIVGRLREYSPSDDWAIFKPRLQNFFLANSITDVERKKAILLNSLDEQAYKLVTNLSVPDKPETKSYDDLLKLFDSHFIPKESVYAARYKFYNAAREANESINDWLARLRSLAGNCQFSEGLDNRILDKFVMGIGRGPIMDRLFEEDATKLTLERALTIASARLATADQYKLDDSSFKIVNIKKEPVNYYKPFKAGQGNISGSPKSDYGFKTSCTVCGGKNHESSKCRYKSYSCKICSQIGHLAKMCKNKYSGSSVKGKPTNLGKKKQEKTYFCDVKESDNEFLFTIQETKGLVSSYKLLLTLNKNIDITFDIDTGTPSTIFPLQLFRKKFPTVQLQATNKTFVSYFENKAKPLGACVVTIEHHGKIYRDMIFYVVEANGPPLLGRLWFEQLGFKIVDTNDNTLVQPVHFVGEGKGLLRELETVFPNVFTNRLGKFSKGKAKLELLPNAVPRFIKARQVPFAMRVAVDAEIDRLVAEGILEPVDYSPYGSPIVPVLKKGGAVRICGDYKMTINPYLKVDQHPLPRAEDLFQRVQGCVVFAKLDLSNAYQQLELDQDSKALVTITTPKGLFQYTRLPYGVACAPAKFQKVMDTLLEGLDGTAALLDDILIGGRDLNELKQRLMVVLRRLEESGLTLSVDKCEIGKPSLEYLGFCIDASGLHTTDEKVRAVVEATRPENVKELQACLGFVNYVAKFLPDVATVLNPLYRLLRKDTPWNWDEKCDQAFLTIKQLVKKNRSLAHYDPRYPIRLTVDGSGKGLGAVISQRHPNGEDKPLAFASRTLTRAEESYSSLHREAAAIIFGVHKFHMYLFGRKWILVSDHKPLVTIFGPKRGIPACTANRLQRWALLLSNYTYDMEWVSTNKNIADWLSRAPLQECPDISEETDVALNYVFEENMDIPLDYKEVLSETKKDKELIKVINYVKFGWPLKNNDLAAYFHHKDELHVEKDILMWGYRVVIPSALRFRVLKELHATHMGIGKVKALARSYVWWPNLDQEIEVTVASCEICNATKDNAPKKTLVPWEWPLNPWQRVHIDYLGPFVNRYYLVMVDSHTKWIEAFPTTSMNAATTIRLLRQVFARFGLPETLVSDNYSAFDSADFQMFLSKNGIKFKSGAPFFPKTNGAAENTVRIVKRSLRNALVEGSPADLDVNLQRFLMDYRNTPHTTTNVAPAQAMMGRLLRNRLDLIRPISTRDRVQEQQNKQIKNYKGKQVKGNCFTVGEMVYARNYRYNEHKWVLSKVTKILGPRRIAVYVSDLNLTWIRHMDQVHRVDGIAPIQHQTMNSRPTTIPVSTVPSRTITESSQAIANQMVGTEEENIIPQMGSGTLEQTPRPHRLKKPVKRLIEEISYSDMNSPGRVLEGGKMWRSDYG